MCGALADVVILVGAIPASLSVPSLILVSAIAVRPSVRWGWRLSVRVTTRRRRLDDGFEHVLARHHAAVRSALLECRVIPWSTRTSVFRDLTWLPRGPVGNSR
jgi:hypothetical protein